MVFPSNGMTSKAAQCDVYFGLLQTSLMSSFNVILALKSFRIYSERNANYMYNPSRTRVHFKSRLLRGKKERGRE